MFFHGETIVIFKNERLLKAQIWKDSCEIWSNFITSCESWAFIWQNQYCKRYLYCKYLISESVTCQLVFFVSAEKNCFELLKVFPEFEAMFLLTFRVGQVIEIRSESYTASFSNRRNLTEFNRFPVNCCQIQSMTIFI